MTAEVANLCVPQGIEGTHSSVTSTTAEYGVKTDVSTPVVSLIDHETCPQTADIAIGLPTIWRGGQSADRQRRQRGHDNRGGGGLGGQRNVRAANKWAAEWAPVVPVHRSDRSRCSSNSCRRVQTTRPGGAFGQPGLRYRVAADHRSLDRREIQGHRLTPEACSPRTRRTAGQRSVAAHACCEL